MSARLFPLGLCVITPAASELLGKAGILPGTLINRHVCGDFGDLCAEDAEANNVAVTTGGRVLSSYPTANGTVWVITEGDRSATTVLLPADY